MYEMTPEQFLTVPLQSDSDHEIISKMIRLSVESKRKRYAELWGESTAERPLINLKEKYQGVITGGELSFFLLDTFVTFKYHRQHAVNITQFKTHSGDGTYFIDGVYVGLSPYTDKREFVEHWRYSRNREMSQILALWSRLDMEAEMNG